MKKFITTLSVICIIFSSIKANNITVSNVALTGQNTTKHSYQVKFDLSWENSWSNGSSWDAAWVFIKYRSNGGTWKHATLNWENGQGASDGHAYPSSALIHSNNDNTQGGSYGAFICPSSIMNASTINYNNIELRWNYGIDNELDQDSFDICVFAVEMIYIPEGAYYLGDGDGIQESTNSFHLRDNNNNFLNINQTMSDQIETDVNGYGDDAYIGGSSSNSNYYQFKIDGDSGIFTYYNSGSTLASSNLNYPTGYKGFYIMKYEVSQQQYVNFLNKIGANHATTRMNNSSQNRYGISGTYPNLAAIAPARAINMVSIDDALAYLDWSALRPMTELEYEKACRGHQTPLVYEFCWGDGSINTSTFTVTNDGLPNATVNSISATGNALYGLPNSTSNGPFRCGIFAASAPNGGRIEAGASNYGVMELSGNLAELTVGVSNTTQRAYQGNEGDGKLNGANSTTKSKLAYKLL